MLLKKCHLLIHKTILLLARPSYRLFLNPVDALYRSAQRRWSQSNDIVKWFEKISDTQSSIKPAGGNLRLITASLLLTALTATQPAGKSNGHLNSRSISRPVSLVWLGRVPRCQPVCWCRRRTLTRRLSCTTAAPSSHSKAALMCSNRPK